MIERTTDANYIRSVIGHPEIRGELFDDEELSVPMHESIYYLAPFNDVFCDPGIVEKCRLGFVAFGPINRITWNPHIAIFPEFRGCGTEAMQLGIAWMFENTPCQKLVAHPPEYNKAMLRVFEKCGFKREGYSPNSFGRHGVLYGRHLLGLEKSCSKV